MISSNNDKPMRKRSKHFADITESCRWWDCSMDHFTEWTFEGDLNNIHEAYRAMYQQ